MTAPNDQQFESFLPTYDTIPEDWEGARQVLVEYLKKIANIVNVAEIGWFLDEELASGKQFIPGNANSQVYRTILRKVIDFGPVIIGANTVAHGIVFDANFTLINLWVSGTDSVGFVAATYVATEGNMDVTNIIFTSPVAYDRCFAFVEYMQEL